MTIQNTGGSNLDWWIAEEAAVRGTNSPNTVNLIARGNGVANGATAADLATEAEAAEATNEMTAEALAQVDVFAPTAVLYDTAPWSTARTWALAVRMPAFWKRLWG
ncbi:MAG: hypothetical protein IPL28_13155 [Chloroflexi bacterium]|nr:hypothetical protein [Chloroflexota bacterium]